MSDKSVNVNTGTKSSNSELQGMADMSGGGQEEPQGNPTLGEIMTAIKEGSSSMNSKLDTIKAELLADRAKFEEFEKVKTQGYLRNRSDIENLHKTVTSIQSSPRLGLME